MVNKNGIFIKHNFETAHRLPHLGNSKCKNIHGHSWMVDIGIDGPLTADGTIIEFGWLKYRVRSWIDAHLDHGTMLGYRDNLLQAFMADGSKVYVFAGGVNKFADDLEWPTVENVAILIWRMVDDLVRGLQTYPDMEIYITVRETQVNGATCYNGYEGDEQ